MGGDGGVIASNRKYMRGAGTADHTADYKAKAAAAAFQASSSALEGLTTCALTHQPLVSPTTSNTSTSTSIVACRLGRLYRKEAAIQVLLSRKQNQNQSTSPSTSTSTSTLASASTNAQTARLDKLPHVRKLSELYAVRGHLEEGDDTAVTAVTADVTAGAVVSATQRRTFVMVCPITSKVLTGSTIPAILLVPGRPDTPNVVSEGALSQLSATELETEYGPIHRKIRLAPPPELLKQVQAELAEERAFRNNKQKQKQQTSRKKNTKKRKLELELELELAPTAMSTLSSPLSMAAPSNLATATATATTIVTPSQKRKSNSRPTSSTAIPNISISIIKAPTTTTTTTTTTTESTSQSAALASLFVDKAKQNNNKKLLSKEQKDHLFARMG